MATIKKACKGTIYPKSSNVSSRLGSVKRAKSGTALKKQAATAIAMKAAGKTPKATMKAGGSLKPVDSSKNPGLAKLPTPVRNKMGYQKSGGKTSASMKKGGKITKKCAYGCK